MSKKEENADRFRRKLEGLENGNSTAMRKGIADSEDRILLRKTDSSSLQPNAGNERKRTSTYLSNEKDEDSKSIDTTISDVNSDDGAASIVSRLSQIVIEQEGRLSLYWDIPVDNVETQDKGDDIPQWRRNSSALSRSSNTLVTPKLNRVRSSSNLPIRRESSIEEQTEFCRQDSNESRKLTDLDENVGLTFKLESRHSSGLPTINVVEHEMDIDHRQEDAIRVRAYSVASSYRDEHPVRAEMRRNESTRFAPERGNLRSLETLRTQQAVAKLSATNKDLAANEILGQSMLNIKRSTWTLPDFEEAFNKTNGDENYETSAIKSSDSDKSASTETLDLNNSIPDRQSGNLLRIASKNALNQQVSLVGNQRKDSFDGTKLRIDSTAPSRRHSVVSFASSMDSFYTDFKRSVGKHSRKKRDDGGDDEDDGSSCLRSCCGMDTIRQYFPILEWLPEYKTNYFWGDLTAGLAVAALNISTSLSAALVAETDLSVAFRASIVNTFVYAILCSSRHTSFGSWSIMSQMLLVSVQRVLSDELTLARLNLGPSATWEPEEYEKLHLEIIIMYTFLIGLVQLVCGLLNLGNIMASFIPEALCSSMIAATAFTMAIGQLANMCGTSNKILWSIEKNTTELWADLKNPPVHITDLFAGLFRWIQQIALLVKYNDQINLVCIIISGASVIFLFLNQYVIQKQLEKLLKRKILIPSEMILLIVMIIISNLMNFSENYRVSTCGPIELEMAIPDVPKLSLIRELWFDSLATALISYTMVYIMAKTYSNKLNYDIDCNQELIACGAGNLIGGLFDALPATASFSRTTGQVEAGGQTQMASIVNCVVLVVLAKLLGQHVSALPICVMAATLFYGFVRMIARFSEVFMYWRVCKVDFAIWVVTFVSILTVDLVNGFVFGFIFSILTMLYRAQTRRCYMLGTIGSSDVYVPLIKYPLAQEIDGIKIFQFCGPIHYVCAELFERLLRSKTRVNLKRIASHVKENDIKEFKPRELNLPTHLILDFSMISFIDSAGLHIIKKIIEDHQKVNITVLFASLASHVAAVVKSEPSLWEVYKDRFYVTLADAVHCAMREIQRPQNLSRELERVSSIG